MNLTSLPVNAFDIVLLAVLAVGIWRGRKHGMSEELMNLAKWLAVVIGCGFLYEPAGRWVAQSSPFSLMASFILVYTGGALLILSVFGFFKRQFGGKLVGSDLFGRSEYYLGMGSGLVRCSCMVLAVLALLNARYFSHSEIMEMEKFQNDVYGSDYFPTLHTIQDIVFQKSIAGHWIKDNLDFLLIKPTQPEDKSYHQKEVALP